MASGVWGFGCDCVAGGCVKRSPYIAGMTGKELSVFISELKLAGFDTWFHQRCHSDSTLVS